MGIGLHEHGGLMDARSVKGADEIKSLGEEKAKETVKKKGRAIRLRKPGHEG
jgi:hypothetical protein